MVCISYCFSGAWRFQPYSLYKHDNDIRSIVPVDAILGLAAVTALVLGVNELLRPRLMRYHLRPGELVVRFLGLQVVRVPLGDTDKVERTSLVRLLVDGTAYDLRTRWCQTGFLRSVLALRRRDGRTAVRTRDDPVGC